MKAVALPASVKANSSKWPVRSKHWRKLRIS